MVCRYKYALLEGQCAVLFCEALSAFRETDRKGQELSSGKEMRWKNLIMLDALPLTQQGQMRNR